MEASWIQIAKCWPKMEFFQTRCKKVTMPKKPCRLLFTKRKVLIKRDPTQRLRRKIKVLSLFLNAGTNLRIMLTTSMTRSCRTKVKKILTSSSTRNFKKLKLTVGSLTDQLHTTMCLKSVTNYLMLKL